MTTHSGVLIKVVTRQEDLGESTMVSQPIRLIFVDFCFEVIFHFFKDCLPFFWSSSSIFLRSSFIFIFFEVVFLFFCGHHSSFLTNIEVILNFQLPRLPGSALKVPGWEGWPYPLSSQAPTPMFACHLHNSSGMRLHFAQAKCLAVHRYCRSWQMFL